MRKKAEKTKQHMRGKTSDLAQGALSEKKGGENKGAIPEKKSERGRLRGKCGERCRQKQGAGFRYRPRKKKEGGAWKWAMTVDSASCPIEAIPEKKSEGGRARGKCRKGVVNSQGRDSDPAPGRRTKEEVGSGR